MQFLYQTISHLLVTTIKISLETNTRKICIILKLKKYISLCFFSFFPSLISCYSISFLLRTFEELSNRVEYDETLVIISFDRNESQGLLVRERPWELYLLDRIKSIRWHVAPIIRTKILRK